MTNTVKTFQLALLATACLSLTACETMNDSMAGVKSGFSNIVTASADAMNSLTKRKTAEKEEPVAEAILAADEGCPEVTAVNDLSSLHRFVDMDNPERTSKISSIVISGIENGCRYTGNNIIVEMNVKFEGEAGNRARIRETDTPSFSYPYFVAVTSPHGTILSKEIHALNVNYEDNANSVVVNEQIRQIIPVDKDAYGPDHTILVGFQLNDKELAYNRKMIRDTAGNAFAMSVPAQKVAPVDSMEAAAIEPAAGDSNVTENDAAPVQITIPDMEP